MKSSSTISRRIWIVLAILFLLTGFLIIASSGLQAKPNEGSGEKDFEVITDYFVPCINGGEGELVTMYIRGHANFRFMVDGRGIGHLTWQYTDQGSYAIDQTTNTLYRVAGPVHLESKEFQATSDILHVNEVYYYKDHFIGKGKGNDYFYHYNVILDIDFNTGDFLNVIIKCERETVQCK